MKNIEKNIFVSVDVPFSGEVNKVYKASGFECKTFFAIRKLSTEIFLCLERLLNCKSGMRSRLLTLIWFTDCAKQHMILYSTVYVYLYSTVYDTVQYSACIPVHWHSRSPSCMVHVPLPKIQQLVYIKKNLKSKMNKKPTPHKPGSKMTAT